MYKFSFGIVGFDVSEHVRIFLGMDDCAEDVDRLVGKAQFLMTCDEDFHAGEDVRLIEKAFKAGGGSSRDIHKWLNDAKKSTKMRKRKDFDKVLGVGRDADEKTIKKASGKQPRAYIRIREALNRRWPPLLKLWRF
ncbi:hypothetical protein L218DRAFT_1039934 [Marasmius fiardii PR-910]|nr:hypothetical protein L218DRAFT_1039934 [Marasmius fiardii PR-910]